MSRALSLLGAGEALYESARKKINELVADNNEHLASGLVVVPVAITADATGGKTFTAPMSMVIIGVDAYCTEANASGTAKLRRGTTDISGAAVMAVANTKTGTTIVNAQKAVTKGEELNVITNGAADRGILYITGYRV